MRRTLGPALLALALTGSTAVDLPVAEATMVASRTHQISGVVTHATDRSRIEGARVTLSCAGQARPRETLTNARGQYVFRSIPAGTGECTVRVMVGHADVTRAVRLAGSTKVRASFTLDPSPSPAPTLTTTPTTTPTTTVGRTISMEEFRNIPIGNSTARDFTQVVESSATAQHHATGISLPAIRDPGEPFDREGYARIDDTPFVSALDRPRSTFAADVDTASYANVRRFIEQGDRPPPDAVRVEELVNYFDYDYVMPQEGRPVSVNWEIAQCPWEPAHLVARIGLQTTPIAVERVPPRNLVFLLDVSGSMSSPDKLPLLQRAMGLLVDTLRPEDRVSIVVYAGSAGVVLRPTSGENLPAIRDAIRRLEPGGSTNGAQGIRLAYQLARESFARRGINRVILATDGDFNVGTTSDGELTRLIEHERESGVFLSVLGFGQGNLQDATMEQLADRGNGNYAYIDDLAEARKVLVEEAGATLVTVAKDVKLQVEFNPAKVSGYRLIGYENRRLADEDFDDDTKDAGDMGAGHSVTALYELVPAGRESPVAQRSTAPLRYQRARTTTTGAGHEWMTVAVRYKAPDSRQSRRMEVPMAGRPLTLDQASDDLRFAAAVAAYGMVLRDTTPRGRSSLRLVRTLAAGALGHDRKGYRAAFLDLVDATAQLDRRD